MGWVQLKQLFRFFRLQSNRLLRLFWVMAEQNNMQAINEDQILHCWFFMAFHVIILFKELMWEIDCRFLLRVFLSNHLMIDRFLFLWEISPKCFFSHMFSVWTCGDGAFVCLGFALFCFAFLESYILHQKLFLLLEN